MRTVHKFTVVVSDLIQLPLPRGSKVVYVEDNKSLTNYLITLWVELDTAAAPVNRQFRIYGTGHEIAKDDFHIASLRQGVAVWHLYDAGEEILPIGMARPTLAATKPRRPLGAK